MKKFYAIGKIQGGQVHLSPTESKRFQRYKATCEGKPVLITCSDISQRRSDEFHRLYRKRNQQISDWTGERPERLHEMFFRKAGLGVFEDELSDFILESNPESQEARRIKVRRFFRESANDILNEDMKELFKLQDELVADLNEDIDPKNWLTLAGGDDIKNVDGTTPKP